MSKMFRVVLWQTPKIALELLRVLQTIKFHKLLDYSVMTMYALRSNLLLVLCLIVMLLLYYSNIFQAQATR